MPLAFSKYLNYKSSIYSLQQSSNSMGIFAIYAEKLGQQNSEICTICFFDGLPKDFIKQDFFNLLKKFLYDFISKIWLPHNIVSNYNIIFWICVTRGPSVLFLVFTHKIEGNEGEIEVTAKWQMSDRIIDVLCGLFMRL